MAQVNLTNHFLIAMPNMVDPFFARTLTLICEHSEKGAVGVVVNRPIEMTLGALFERLSLPSRVGDSGPRAGLFRRAGPDRSRIRVASAARQVAGDPFGGRQDGTDDLQGHSRGGRAGGVPTRCWLRWVLGLGCRAARERNQAKRWLTVEAKDAIIFDTPAEERLPAAMKLLGVDFAKLSEEQGTREPAAVARPGLRPHHTRF